MIVTVAFEEETHKVVPREPTPAMARAGNEASDWYVKDADDIYRAALLEAPPHRTALLPMSTAPRDGTRVLVRFGMDKTHWPGQRETNMAGVMFVASNRASNRGDSWYWSFAAAGCYGGIPDNYLDGWLPLPVIDAPPTEGEAHAVQP